MRRFTPKSAGEWRRWLERNHADESGVWLVFYKKHTGKPTLSYDEAVEEALCFGWIDSIKRGLDEERYTFKFTPRNTGSNWSPSNIRRARKLIAEGRMQASGLALVEHARANGAWGAATAPRQFEMPAEFRDALAASPRAAAFFESLPPSQKRQFIGWIALAKRAETRANRLARAMELLEKGERLGMV